MSNMKIIRKLWNSAGLPCRKCGGKGYVVDADVAKFIEQNGLAAFQAATALMTNEDMYGHLSSLSVCAWEDLGMTEDAAEDFCTGTGHVHVLHCCRSCNGQPNHSNPMGTAMAVIEKWIEQQRKDRAEWRARQTPADRRLNRHKRMASAIRYQGTLRRSFVECVGEL